MGKQPPNKPNKEYECVFAKGTEHEGRYPIAAPSKVKALEEFSRQYIGRVDSTFIRLCKAYEVTECLDDDPK